VKELREEWECRGGLYLLAMDNPGTPSWEQPVRDASDVEVCRAAAAGDHAAFHVLIDRHGPALLRVAKSLSGSRSDAEDICQETFMAAFRGLKNFDGRASIRTWLMSILMRRAAKAWKKERHARRTISIQGRVLHHETGRGTLDETRAGEFSVPSATESSDQRLDILEAIRSLAPEFRDSIVLREIEGLTYQEIAEVLGVPRGTVESRLYRGRALLREKLKGYQRDTARK